MLHRWHRRIGIVVVIVIAVVCATGLLLNHTGRFDLDARYVSNRLLLNRYNVGAPEPAGGIHLGGHWIVQLGHRVYFDSVESLSGTEGLVSAIVQGELLVVAFDNEVVVYAETGANPRDAATDTSGHRGLDMAGARRMLYEAGFTALRRGDGTTVLLTLDSMAQAQA